MEFDEIEVVEKPESKPGPFGRYYLQELINSGGMAEIWLATDPENQTIALRRLHKKLRFNLLARRRFWRGCEVLSEIHNHEHVIGYLDHGKIEGTPFLAMEYVEGSNLKLMLSRGDPALGENVAQILIDMAVALEHVHDSGYMHLDFKPENILITRNAKLRLLDFDLAQPKPETPKKMSRTSGTPAYMAPEQLQRQEIDQRADIFAYGVAAYEVLTGVKPFPGETPSDILGHQLNELPTAPREINAEIPVALEKIVMKCIQRAPAARYPDMSIVVRDLQSALYI